MRVNAGTCTRNTRGEREGEEKAERKRKRVEERGDIPIYNTTHTHYNSTRHSNPSSKAEYE